MGKLRVFLGFGTSKATGGHFSQGDRGRRARSPALFAARSHSFWDFLGSWKGSPLGRRQHFQVVWRGLLKTRGFLCFLSPAPPVRKDGGIPGFGGCPSQIMSPANKVKTRKLFGEGQCERLVEEGMMGRGREGRRTLIPYCRHPRLPRALGPIPFSLRTWGKAFSITLL